VWDCSKTCISESPSFHEEKHWICCLTWSTSVINACSEINKRNISWAITIPVWVPYFGETQSWLSLLPPQETTATWMAIRDVFAHLRICQISHSVPPWCSSLGLNLLHSFTRACWNPINEVHEAIKFITDYKTGFSCSLWKAWQKKIFSENGSRLWRSPGWLVCLLNSHFKASSPHNWTRKKTLSLSLSLSLSHYDVICIYIWHHEWLRTLSSAMEMEM